MRSRAPSLAACFALLALGGCSSFLHVPGLPPAREEAIGRAFSREEIAADVEHYVALLEEVHPDPYRTISREEFRARCDALIAAIDRPLTRAALQPRLAELIATLGDGHTSIYDAIDEFWRDPQGAGSSFPIDVAWDGHSMKVRHTAVVTPDGGLGIGAELLEINGRSPADLVQTFLPRKSGESEASRIATMEDDFAFHLWLDGVRTPFRLKVVSAVDPSDTFGIEISGVPYGGVAIGAGASGGADWRLERRDDGVALLTIDTLQGDLDDFEDFIEPTFESLAKDPPSALVIDLRRNGGGDSRLGDELMQYLSDEPWRQCARKEWKMSAPTKKFLKSILPAWIRWAPVQYLHPTGRKIWGTPNGELVILEEERVTPRKEPLRYRGPLAWLIGPSTFSAGMGLAAGAQDCHRGLLVGGETGGSGNGFGEVVPFRLPNTQLGLQISTAFFVRGDGDRSVRGGIKPDLAVSAAPRSRMDPAAPGAGVDAVLEAAIEALREPAVASQ